jgi:hypothetical protein
LCLSCFPLFFCLPAWMWWWVAILWS